MICNFFIRSFLRLGSDIKDGALNCGIWSPLNRFNVDLVNLAATIHTIDCIPYYWMGRSTGDMEPSPEYVDTTPRVCNFDLRLNSSRPSVQSFCLLNSWGFFVGRDTIWPPRVLIGCCSIQAMTQTRCVSPRQDMGNASTFILSFWFSIAIILRYYQWRHILLYPSVLACYYSATFY